MQTLRKALSAAISIALVLGIVLFATRPMNQQAVEVHYLFGEASWPLWQLVGGAFAAGALAVWLVSVLPWTRAKLSVRRHRKHVERLETELHQLRNLPLSQNESDGSPAGVVRPGGGSAETQSGDASTAGGG